MGTPLSSDIEPSKELMDALESIKGRPVGPHWQEEPPKHDGKYRILIRGCKGPKPPDYDAQAKWESDPTAKWVEDVIAIACHMVWHNGCQWNCRGCVDVLFDHRPILFLPPPEPTE